MDDEVEVLGTVVPTGSGRATGRELGGKPRAE